eukprot:GHVS01011685.1.p1 GENE.GHVS01011685.1~~GHVS01011685.1.p1  ORF type:complete len:501 (-),score=59.18 GHVS01011685.1:651-2153(-)
MAELASRQCGLDDIRLKQIKSQDQNADLAAHYPRLKTSMCFFHKKGRCVNSDNCRFAHGLSELKRHQSKFLKTIASKTSANSSAVFIPEPPSCPPPPPPENAPRLAIPPPPLAKANQKIGGVDCFRRGSGSSLLQVPIQHPPADAYRDANNFMFPSSMNTLGCSALSQSRLSSTRGDTGNSGVKTVMLLDSSSGLTFPVQLFCSPTINVSGGGDGLGNVLSSQPNLLPYAGPNLLNGSCTAPQPENSTAYVSKGPTSSAPLFMNLGGNGVDMLSTSDPPTSRTALVSSEFAQARLSPLCGRPSEHNNCFGHLHPAPAGCSDDGSDDGGMCGALGMSGMVLSCPSLLDQRYCCDPCVTSVPPALTLERDITVATACGQIETSSSATTMTKWLEEEDVYNSGDELCPQQMDDQLSQRQATTAEPSALRATLLSLIRSKVEETAPYRSGYYPSIPQSHRAVAEQKATDFNYHAALVCLNHASTTEDLNRLCSNSACPWSDNFD